MRACARVLRGMPKRRLDTLLAERGLFPSRSRAAASVMAGEVRIGGPEGRRAAKPSELVDEQERIALQKPREFASRGGIKLANALESAALGVAGRRALDVGSLDGRLHRLPAPAWRARGDSR